METVYVRINWQNQPSTATALGATNLNKIDLALSIIDGRVVAINTTKLDVSVANTLVQDVTVDDNGVFTIKKLDGSTTKYDTKLEKIAVNFTYDSATQKIVITLDDGTKQYVDLSSLITEYEFTDSSTIGFTVTDGKVSASVKNGSITAEKLQANYLADITVQQQTATAQAKLAKRYAVGGVEAGDTTDNAKYYKEQAELFKTQAKQYRDEAQDISGVGIAGESKLGLVKGDGNVEIESDGDMWADPYKDKGTVTGTFINFKSADDAMAQVNIKGATTVVPTNPDLPISPDNKATLVSPLNFDLVSNMGNWFNTDNPQIVLSPATTYDPINKSFTNTAALSWSKLFNDLLLYVKPNTKYTLSIKVKQEGENTGAFGVYAYSDYPATTDNQIAYASKTDLDTTISITFTTKSSGKLVIRCNTTTATVIQNRKSVWSEFNLVEGESATPYTPYKEDRVNIPFDMGEWNEIKDGQYLQGASEVTYDGSSDENWVFNQINTYGLGNFYITLNGYKNSITYCNRLNQQYTGIQSTQTEGFHLANSQIYVRIFTSRISGWSDSLSSSEKANLFKQWLLSNQLIFRYQLATPTYTTLNTYLKTFKGTTNIYSTATPQVELTATFKSQLWTDSYNKENAINSKIDANKRVNNLLATDPTTVLSGPMGKLLQENIDAVSKNMPKQINYWGDSQLNLLKKINDVTDTTFRTVIINGWDSVFTDADMPYRNTVWHIAIYNNGRDINIWQRWTNLDNGSIYMRLYNPSSNSWGGDWISNDIKQTADLLPEADILPANSSVYPSMVSKIGNVVTLSFLFKKRDGSNFTVGQNVLLAKIPSGYTTTTNLCASGLGSMTEDLSSPDTTKPQSIVFWNNGIFAHIAHETKVIGGSITYFI